MSLHFDPVAHRYTFNGEVVPSVTQILQPLMDFSMVPADVLKAKQELGTAAHLACELYDLDDLLEDSLDPAIVPYLEGWKKFRLETGFVPSMTEQRVYHPKLGYAGTFDSYGILNGKTVLLDRKTSSFVSEAVAGPQTAAYEQALLESPDYTGPKKMQRGAVQLKPDGTYKYHPYKGGSDWSVFVSLLTLHNWRKRHGL